ncbi:MAG: sigma-70 family RNA polymerase sigma factor [Caldilineae bacterium]|nr:MAG: sigma-70 family RNA polymerase sigma factor [Caldilineae bacterium]
MIRFSPAPNPHDGSSAEEQRLQDSASSNTLPLADLPEERLVELAKSDAEAFGELYRRHVDRIYSYIYYRVGNRDDAEDLTARTFFQALDKIDTFEYRGAPFSSWLYRIAHNLVANWHRQQSRRRSVPLEELLTAGARHTNPSVLAEKREIEQELLDAIHRLAADRQQLLILKFVERLPNAQIGEIMGRSESSVKSLYHRTLIALREELQERGVL